MGRAPSAAESQAAIREYHRDRARKQRRKGRLDGILRALNGHLPAWYAEANCKGKTELFYPGENPRGGPPSESERRALHICAACTVKDECREQARAHHELGIWGGETERHRRLARYEDDLDDE